MKRNKRLFNLKMMQQKSRCTGIFAGDGINLFEYFHSAGTQVTQITNWSCNEIKCSQRVDMWRFAGTFNTLFMLYCKPAHK